MRVEVLIYIRFAYLFGLHLLNDDQKMKLLYQRQNLLQTCHVSLLHWGRCHGQISVISQPTFGEAKKKKKLIVTIMAEIKANALYRYVNL